MDPIYIEVITSPNCPHSPKALKIASRFVSKCKFPVIVHESSIITEEGQAMADELSLESTPAILINGRLTFVGVPTSDELRGAVMEAKAKEHDRNTYFF
ncbi:thioredoxin family protein [Candidatus Micrarchaeota archaeon]|nr:thioredoxin family protein [Candidatus Micrarchaeota archaeon]